MTSMRTRSSFMGPVIRFEPLQTEPRVGTWGGNAVGHLVVVDVGPAALSKHLFAMLEAE